MQTSTTLAWAAEHDVPTLHLPAAWEGVDPKDMRADSVHLHAPRHARLAHKLDGWLGRLGWVPPAPSCDG